MASTSTSSETRSAFVSDTGGQAAQSTEQDAILERMIAEIENLSLKSSTTSRPRANTRPRITSVIVDTPIQHSSSQGATLDSGWQSGTNGLGGHSQEPRRASHSPSASTSTVSRSQDNNSSTNFIRSLPPHLRSSTGESLSPSPGPVNGMDHSPANGTGRASSPSTPSLSPTKSHISASPAVSHRPGSPLQSTVSSVKPNSAISTQFTKVSLAQAARTWQTGDVPRPVKRDGVITAEPSSRYSPEIRLSNGNSRPRSNGLGTSAERANGYRPSSTSHRLVPGRQVRPQSNPQRSLHNGVVNGQPLPSLSARNPSSHPSMHFEIRISDIPLGSKKEELYGLLASQALHRAPFAQNRRKINFWLHLPPAKVEPGNWGESNSGYGFLTLPTAEDAHRFMSMYRKGGSLSVRAKHARVPLVFEVGRSKPLAGLVEWLVRTDYRNKGDGSARAAMDRLAENLQVDRLEWGVFCRDGVFSPEYIKNMHKARFFFDSRWKNFRLCLLYEKASTGEPPMMRLIVFKSSAIRLLLSSVEDDWYYVTLIMKHPPAYEELRGATSHNDLSADSGDHLRSDMPNDGVDFESNRMRDFQGRRRQPCFDAEHASLSAFTSRVIRFRFDTEQQRNTFEDLLSHVGCPNAKYVELEHENRRVCDKNHRKDLADWLKGLESRSVAFQLARLYQNCLLTPPEVMSLRPVVERLYAVKGEHVTADVLHQYVEEVTRLEDRWLDRILKDKSYNKQLSQGNNIVDVLEDLEAKGLHRIDWRENYKTHVMQCLHVILTPTSMLLEGPYPDQSNRPLRKYGHHDHFIRVAFMDEDKTSYHWGPDIDWTAFLEERVGRILRSGITLAGRKYEFLGYSMSSLRNRSTWFCTKFMWIDDEEGREREVTAAYIRDHLGDFERVKRQPARYGARMAQAFTATDPSITLEPRQIEEIPDVEATYRGETVCFTDGVGKISLALTTKVWRELHNGMEPIGIQPSAFQFRLGGFKGVLTVDSELEGEKICVRPSQQKFDAPDSNDLEIAYTFCRYVPMFLNRPLIKVLEDLQVPHEVFMELLKEAILRAQGLKEHIRETRRQLTLHGLGGPFAVTELVENIGALLRTNRIAPLRDGGSLTNFIADSLGFAEVHILRMLKLKARVPVAAAHVGVAVADESGVLKEGEIYTLRHNPGESPEIVKGEVLLVRAPTVDVGDVQIAHAVGTAPPGAERFKHIPNVVIFSTKGQRPLLTSLARGDMDGDLVGVIYDKRLFPKRTEPAMHHTPKKPVDLQHDCTIREVVDFVLRFFRNDILGQIASRQINPPKDFKMDVALDIRPARSLLPSRPLLSTLQRAGSPSIREMPAPLIPHKPDFICHEQASAKAVEEGDQLIYRSQKILGKLYRAVRLSDKEEDNELLRESPLLEARYIPAGEDDHVLLALCEELEKCVIECSRQESDGIDREQAWYVMHTYASDLRHIAWSNTMNAGHPLSEHEIFIGTVLHGNFAMKNHVHEVIARINLQCKELVDGVLSRLEGSDGRDHPQVWANRVLAALRIAVSQGGNFGAQTFGAIATKSTLYLLALLKDVRRADALNSLYDAPDVPYEPVLDGVWRVPPDMEATGVEGALMSIQDDMPFAIPVDLPNSGGLRLERTSAAQDETTLRAMRPS